MRGRKRKIERSVSAALAPAEIKDPAKSIAGRIAANRRWNPDITEKQLNSAKGAAKRESNRAKEYAQEMQRQMSLKATESRLQAQAVFIAHTKEAADIIVDIMRNDKYAAAARLDAAKTILKAQGVIDRPDAAQTGVSSIWDTDIQEVEHLISEHQSKRTKRIEQAEAQPTDS